MDIQDWERLESGNTHDLSLTGGLHIFQKLYQMAEAQERVASGIFTWVCLGLAVAMLVGGVILFFCYT